MELTNRTIFITGGTSGLGLELSRVLLEMGNRVIACARSDDRLADLERRLPGVQTHRCDVTKDSDAAAVAAALEVQSESLDILINNAGVLRPRNLSDPDCIDAFREEWEINSLGPVRMTKALLPLLLRSKEPAVVNISSGVAYAPAPALAGYSASKAALHSWTRALRFHLHDTLIKVFEVMPPPFDTPMTARYRIEKLRARQVADAVIRGIARDHLEIRIGQVNSLRLLARLWPSAAEQILERAFHST